MYSSLTLLPWISYTDLETHSPEFSLLYNLPPPPPRCSSWEGRDITFLLQEEGWLLPVAPGKEGKGQDFFFFFFHLTTERHYADMVDMFLRY